MRTPSEILAAVDHLPPAAVLALDNITWEEYEQITEDFEERQSSFSDAYRDFLSSYSLLEIGLAQDYFVKLREKDHCQRGL